MAEPKKRKTKAEPKLEKVAPVTQFKIPARYEWGTSPLEIVSEAKAEDNIKAKSPDTTLEGAIVGDFVVVRNQDCDETFILHKDVLKELLDEASA
jgi:hypothetical protein